MTKDADYRLFIKVHNGFPEHRKTVGLSDRAFRNLVELWCYCSRNLTDGIVPKPYGNKILSRKSREELVSASYMIERKSDYEMLEYLDHQMSAQDVADLRKKRAEAGSRGGRAKATALASATASAVAKPKQSSSKNVADIDVDIDVDKRLTTTTPVVTVRRSTSRGTRLPADWQPDARLIEWVKKECPAVNGRTETEQFRDYWHSSAGRNATKRDWSGAYRVWMRKTQEQTPQPRAGRPAVATSDQRAYGALSVAQRLAEREAETEHLEIER